MLISPPQKNVLLSVLTHPHIKSIDYNIVHIYICMYIFIYDHIYIYMYFLIRETEETHRFLFVYQYIICLFDFVWLYHEISTSPTDVPWKKNKKHRTLSAPNTLFLGPSAVLWTDLGCSGCNCWVPDIKLLTLVLGSAILSLTILWGA